MSAPRTPPPERRPFFGQCDGCDHAWLVCYLPMDLRAAGKVMTSARCPMCGGAQVSVPKQSNGVLTEPRRGGEG